MTPVLNGAPGFILLAFVVALGEYLRQLDVAATDLYEKIRTGSLRESWPLERDYTKRRLANLERVHGNARFLAFIMFCLIVAASFRLIAYAVYVTPEYNSLVPNAMLYRWDLGMTAFLAIALFVMWMMHLWTSHVENSCVKAMRQATDTD